MTFGAVFVVGVTLGVVAIGLSTNLGQTETGFMRLATPVVFVLAPVYFAMSFVIGELKISEEQIVSPVGWFRPATAQWTNVQSIHRVSRFGNQVLQIRLASTGKPLMVSLSNYHDSELIERAVLDAWASSRGGLDP